MRIVSSLSLIVAAVATFACGGSAMPTAPPSTELTLAVVLSPDAAGGMRPSTSVSALLVENDVVKGELQSAVFTVFDAQGAVLARRTVSGPLAFGPDHTLTIRQVLDWTPAEVLGRSLNLQLVMSQPSPVIDRTITF